jgi:DNA-binding transcriptional MerR regulator
MSEHLETASAARLLGIASETVRDWANRGLLPCEKTDTGRRIFKRSDLERVRQEREAKRNHLSEAAEGEMEA